MRDLIVEEIDTIAERENGFLKTTMRWSVKFKDKFVCEVDYPSLSDLDLLIFYRLVIKQVYKQM